MVTAWEGIGFASCDVGLGRSGCSSSEMVPVLERLKGLSKRRRTKKKGKRKEAAAEEVGREGL